MSEKRQSKHPLGEQLNRLNKERQGNVFSVIKNSRHNRYSNYLLEGVIYAEVNPVITVALFPADEGEDQIVFAFKKDHKPVNHYWKRIKELHIPKRVKKLEDQYYGELDRPEMENYKDTVLTPECAAFNMPLIIIMFSRTIASNKESVHIYHRDQISPSMALKQMQEAAVECLIKSS